MGETVVLGLSGGVDSAVAALLLREQGFRVHGVYLDNGVGNADAARQAARELNISFQTVNIQAELACHVRAPFARAYLEGRTPNPCALCNPKVKFPALLAVADRLGAPWVATGHYARAQNGLLLRGRPANDQSYLLSRLESGQLRRCLFPLGDYDKAQVRALARSHGLTVADAPASMEICFIPDNDYAGYLERQGFSAPPGNFVDREGNVLGRHGGIHRYTLGQGSGLGVSGPCKYYVSQLRPATNEVVLSDGSDLFTQEVLCRDLNWLVPSPPTEVTVRFRHSKTELSAVLKPLPDGRLLVETQTPARCPTPGQLAAFYQGEVVAGSGWIC